MFIPMNIDYYIAYSRKHHSKLILHYLKNYNGSEKMPLTPVPFLYFMGKFLVEIAKINYV